MSKAFDATLNTLIDAHVGDGATFLTARAGVPPGSATVLSAAFSLVESLSPTLWV